MKLLSVNVGRARAVPYTDEPEGLTGIDKRPTDGPVRVAAPGPKGVGGSGLAGDAVCNPRTTAVTTRRCTRWRARTSTTGSASWGGR